MSSVAFNKTSPMCQTLHHRAVIVQDYSTINVCHNIIYSVLITFP